MVYVYRVVCRLVELMQDSHVSPTDCGGREHGETELLLVDSLRAAEREENTSLFDFLQGDGVEAGVSLDGVADGVFVLGKSRGVQYDQVVVLLMAYVAEKSEGVFREGFMAFVVGEIQFDVGVSQVDCFRAAVNGMYQLSPTSHGIYGKAASVAKHV